ncbi:MAG: tRNA lysidine(34) synthetase TilS [Phycisphaerae bacterium]|nr:tRNA lysidine(34) synthetase TilS [Phycisphaerae bacterium]
MDSAPLQKVVAFITQYALLSREDRLLVAVSGGADSTALLAMLVALKQDRQIKDVMCVHFNHQLRDEADRDQAFVQHLSDTWAIPLILETMSVKAHAQALHCSIETAGRQWRQARLIHLARTQGCSAIVTGHHQDDNAETLIHRLSRGTGYRGLCGIRPVRVHQQMRFISPLLALTRQDILTFLDNHHLTWCEDVTNLDLTYTRNYIRQALLPGLLVQCPELKDRLRALSQRCLTLYTRRIEPRVVTLWIHVNIAEDRATIALEAIARESTLVLVEMIRQVLTHLKRPLQPVTQWHYQAVVDLIRGNITHVTLPGRMFVVRDSGQIRFVQANDTPAPTLDAVELAIPGSTRFGDLCFFTRFVKTAEIRYESRSNRSIEYFDRHKMRLPLHIRQRTPGDRFIPLGKHTLQKVGKFLSRAHVTALEQRHMAILCDDTDDILWICPVRMADKAKINQETEEVLEVVLRIDPEI